MAASNLQDLLAIVPKKVTISSDKLLPARNLKPVANITPAKKIVIPAAKILPSRNIKPVANVASAKKIAVPKSSILKSRNVKLATPVNRTLKPTAKIVTAKTAATSKPQTLRTIKPVSTIVQTRPSVIDNYVQSNRRIALQKASANLMREISDMPSPAAAANLIQNRTVVESDIQVPEALLRARANKVLSPLVLKPISKSSGTPVYGKKIAQEVVAAVPAPKKVIQSKRTPLVLTPVSRSSGTPVYNKETVREIVSAVPAQNQKYDMQTFVNRVKHNQAEQARVNDAVLRVQATGQPEKVQANFWKEFGQGLEQAGMSIGLDLSGAEGQRVAEEAAKKIDKPTTPVEKAIFARGESSTNYPIDSMDQEPDESSSRTDDSKSDDVTKLPANPKKGDTGTWYDGRTVTWNGTQWQLPKSEDDSEPEEEEPAEEKPVKKIVSKPDQKAMDSAPIVRGDNTYRAIREIDPSDLDDIDKSGLYYIERSNGRKSVLSGESLMRVNTSDAKVTEVELITGTPTRSDIDIKKYIKGSEEGRVVAIGKSYYDALIGGSKNPEVTERQIADSLASGKMGISVDQVTGKVKISPFTKDPTAITQDQGVFRALPYKTLKNPEGKKVDVPEWAYKKLQHVGKSDKEISALGSGALKTISVGNIGSMPVSHLPKKSGVLNALDYYYDEALTQAKALSYDADTRLVNDGLFTREAIEKLPDSALGWASVALNTPYNYILQLQGEGDTLKGYNMKPTVQGVMYLNSILDDLANGKNVTDIQSTNNMLGYELVKYAFLYGDKEKAKNVANKNPRAILQLASDAGDFPDKLKSVIGGGLYEKAAKGAMTPEEKAYFESRPANAAFVQLASSGFDSSKDLNAVQRTSSIEVIKGILSPGITSSAAVNWALALPATILKPVTMVAGAAKSLKLAKGAEGAINAVDETGRIIGRVSSAGKDSMVVTDVSKGLQYTLKKEGDGLVTTVSKIGGEDAAKPFSQVGKDIKLSEAEPVIADDLAEAVPAETTPAEEIAADSGYVEEAGYVEPSYAETSYGGGGGYADAGGSYVDEAGYVDEGYGVADEGYGATDEGYGMAMPAEEPVSMSRVAEQAPPQTTEIYSQELGALVRQNADGSMSVYDEASGSWLGEDDYKNLITSRQADEVPRYSEESTTPQYAEEPIARDDISPGYVDEPSTTSADEISSGYVDEPVIRAADDVPPSYVEPPTAIGIMDDVPVSRAEESTIIDDMPSNRVDEPDVSVRTVEEVVPESQVTEAMDEVVPESRMDEFQEAADEAASDELIMPDSLADKVASPLSDDALMAQKALADDPVGCAEHAENILAVAIRQIEKDAPVDEVRSLLQKAKDANAKVREKIRLCKV